MSEPVRDATWDERATWGRCPACSAGHGEWCRAEVGAHLGIPVSGRRLLTGEGPHLVRLQRAPLRVRLVVAA